MGRREEGVPVEGGTNDRKSLRRGCHIGGRSRPWEPGDLLVLAADGTERGSCPQNPSCDPPPLPVPSPGALEDWGSSIQVGPRGCPSYTGHREGPERRVSLSPAPWGMRVVDGSHTPAQALGTAAKQEWGGLHVLALPTFQVCDCRAPGYATPLMLYVIWRDTAPSIAGLEQGCQPSAPQVLGGCPRLPPQEQPAMIGSMVQEGVSPWW